MIDVHCHINFHAYKDDADKVIKNALGSGVEIIINVGTKLDSSEKAIALAKKYDELYAIVGVHPHHADKKDLANESKETKESKGPKGEEWLIELETLARQPKVVAIGEIGMDYYKYQSN